MYWKIFKLKKYWISLLCFSLIGMSIGIYLIHKEEEKMRNAKTCNVIKTKDVNIIISDNNKIVLSYLKYSKGELNYFNYQSQIIKKGQKVYMIDSTYNGEIIEIKYYGKYNEYEQRKGWVKGWIYKKYLEYC